MKSVLRPVLSLAAAIVLMVGGAWVSPASAAQLPDGSWRNSCRDGHVIYNTLIAECRRNDGRYRKTTTHTDGCRRFGNNDGHLFCEESAVAGGWHGSYRNSCINERVDKKGRLKADCPRADGRLRKAELSPGKCPSRRAGNVDGRLVCEGSDFGGSGGSGGGGSFGGSGGSVGGNVQWQGSFRQSCRDANTDAQGNLRASCQKANGRWELAYLAERSCPSHRAGNVDGRLVCE